MLILAIVTALVPVAVLTYRGIEGLGFHFGIVAIIISFEAASYLILRIVLWNTHGKETLTFTEEGIIYQADYKYFKGREIVVAKSKNMQFSSHNKEKDTCLFSTENKEADIQNVLPISRHHLQKIQQEFNQYYSN